MWQLRKALGEIRYVLGSISLLLAFLDFLIIFTISLIILSFLSMPWHYSAFPAGIYFIYHTLRLVNATNLITVEKKFPFLKEELRTAADNIGRDNEIISELDKEVLGKMKKVDVARFIDFNNIFRKIMLLFCLSFILIFLGSLNLKTINLPSLIESEIFTITKMSRPSMPELPPEEDILEIYGEPTDVKIGNTDLKLTINPVETDINIDEVKPIQEKFFLVTFPDDIEAPKEASYEEDISEENKEVVKNYFNKLTKR